VVGFLVLEGLWMFCFGLDGGAISSMAMERGQIDGSAASARLLTMILGAFAGSPSARVMTGQPFRSRVGTLACGFALWPWWRWPRRPRAFQPGRMTRSGRARAGPASGVDYEVKSYVVVTRPPQANKAARW